MNDTWYDMGFDADMSWMYDWKIEKEKKMGISETKKQIVIDNYFKRECDVNTSIKEAYTKGFELGLKKAPIPSVESYKEMTNGEVVEMLFPEEITNKLFLNMINFWEMPYKGKERR